MGWNGRCEGSAWMLECPFKDYAANVSFISVKLLAKFFAVGVFLVCGILVEILNVCRNYYLR